MNDGNDIEINDELIVKYLAGEASPEEAMALTDWLENSANKLHYESLSATWNSVHPLKNGRTVDRTEAWKKLDQKIVPASKTSAGIFSSKLSLRIAASLALIVVAGVAIYLKLADRKKTIETFGNFQTITFPDNSKAKLYKNTSITFPIRFRGDSRAVTLIKGEVFFSITPDKSKPFVIHASDADITVVGTAFNVIVKNDSVEVGVQEGSVVLSTANDALQLVKGTSATVIASTGRIAKNNPADANDWAYATQRFVFNDTPVRDVIRDLEKAFSISIAVSNDNIENCKLTATFDNDSAGKIVDLIAESLNLSLRENEGVFTLEGEGCP
jgi:transmembrane sensor